MYLLFFSLLLRWIRYTSKDFAQFQVKKLMCQFLWLALDPQDDRTEYILTWVMFILSILVLVMGRFAAKYENKPFMACRSVISRIQYAYQSGFLRDRFTPGYGLLHLQARSDMARTELGLSECHEITHHLRRSIASVSHCVFCVGYNCLLELWQGAQGGL